MKEKVLTSFVSLENEEKFESVRQVRK